MNEHELLRRFPNASKSMLARNKHVTVDGLTVERKQPPMTIAPTTDVSKLNKTEALYYWELKNNSFYKWVGVQCVTLKLGDDCRYTPDFICIDNGGDMVAKEVKGFWRDDAKVKIKVAARMFPFIKFEVVQKDKEMWINTEVKP